MSSSSPTPGSLQPKRSALKLDGDSDKTLPTSAANKVVQIAEPEQQAPEESHHRKQFAAAIAKRLSGRLPSTTGSSRTSMTSHTSGEGSGPQAAPASSTNLAEDVQRQRSHGLDRASERIIAQIADWLQREKAKKAARKSLKLSTRRSPPAAEKGDRPSSSASHDSDSSEVSLDRLQRILDDSMEALGINSVPHFHPGRKHRKQLKKLSISRTASSDTEFFEGDVVVPACDGFLDNSKTLSYSGGKAGGDDASSSTAKEEKDRQSWITFKNEIIRLAHTLRLKGWRRVPLNSGEKISVERLSGALTNAVYVVSPLPESMWGEGKKQPKKVLLRIYGPQVEHLIDREKELGVLRRLARKKIGPRLLGTFLNGRFEQYFESTTLTPSNLREPETSKQIAKRMRELHDGVELLEEEKDEGPNVLRNWDKWLDQVEKTVTFLDNQILSGSDSSPQGPADAWKEEGFVCGVEWAVFKAMVEKYRKFLVQYYGSERKIRKRLVFAHNDTQYGNILRIRPDDQKSPLLQPANEHKQLIVIDFEYAAANVAGLEFANHFSEWTYNYHDPVKSYACDTSKYPTAEQQERFIKAYVEHRPKISQSTHSTPSSSSGLTPSTPGTPGLRATPSASSIVDFMLDARAPAGSTWKEEEARREEESEKRIKELVAETRLWRIANSAQWVAWGIVQAKIPGLKLVPDPSGGAVEEEGTDAESEPDADADSFDYLRYSQDRARFFWGDCVLMGLVQKEELPAELQSALKLVPY